MQKLSNACNEFGASNDIQYNSEKSEKSVTMCCRSKAVKDMYVPVFTPGLEPIVKVEHCQYLASLIMSLHVRGNML